MAFWESKHLTGRTGDGNDDYDAFLLYGHCFISRLSVLARVPSMSWSCFRRVNCIHINFMSCFALEMTTMHLLLIYGGGLYSTPRV